MAHCSSHVVRQTAFCVAHSRRTSSQAHLSPRRHAASLLAPRHIRTVPTHNRAQARPVQAAAAAEVGKLIAKTEIPAFIPRQDLMDQLLRWAYTEVQEEGLRKFGLACKVQSKRREGIPWGFTTSIMRDGATLTDISVSFDEEVTHKYDWVGKGSDGFPQLEGDAEEIVGKHFMIRKADDNTIDNETRTVIRMLCQEIQASINKYYAFGSCFVDDST